ncbi:2-isopropylmalate synthase [Permianibacter aggregans]|uniref:2-isopropylmalate synthase n=1 Tax=Permianibacter aggregans TaxID=1510150 RepID=A0A4R6UKX7_9GAMM|nr:2-isopropylmalate synthase [Permianibacter aggregans]QGX41175.1 2-isopropylmalate synthase [Permianibacter aggregans]TDQ45775.1 2-isopropylmalate synthase [Permianibacter aggregans]
MSEAQKLIIFDTTLRDGEQSPGASMDRDEKVAIARMLERMRVDVIEAGFAIASPGDFESVQAVATAVKDSTVCSLSRALDKDIERAAEALKPAARGRIHTFIATSPIHMKFKLQMEPDKVIEQAVRAVKKARSLIDDVEFSCEDAGRSELDFLCRIIEQVIDAGARTINIPDTVGYAMPRQYGETIRQLIERIPNSDKAIFSVHCHNDLGLAVANSLDAVMAGARQVECTINGLGERAGNASLEEIVMAVRTRKDFFPVYTDIDTTHIVPTSKLVSRVTGFPVQPNKAIVGNNAFAHESGIHQDGMLKNRETYEIMRAEDVGWSTNRMVLGKHSGRNAFKSHLAELGVLFASEAELNAAFARFKELADKKHDIFDDDLLAIAKDSQQLHVAESVKLVSLNVHSETGEQPTAKIVLNINGEEKRAESQGNGPVDAAFRAINALIQEAPTVSVQEYTVNAVTQGMDSQVEVNVRVEHDNHIVTGHGADLDILVASAKAYLHALNTLSTVESRLHPHVH